MIFTESYKEFIAELEGDFENETIQILRGDEIPISSTESYKPIIDWYLNEQDVEELMNDPECPKYYKEQYIEDKPFLEHISGKDCLEEMKLMCRTK